jgi:hypothetical protein
MTTRSLEKKDYKWAIFNKEEGSQKIWLVLMSNFLEEEVMVLFQWFLA